MATIYGLKNCDTCRKALKALPDAEFRDVRTDGVPSDLLRCAYETFGEKLLNTRSTTWRELDEIQRQRPPLELINENPTLMKRPLITAGDTLFLGWTAQSEEQVRAAG